jgi:chromosome segregation ATPase
MVVYADERPLLQTLLMKCDGGGLRIAEMYESGAAVCRVSFSVVKEQNGVFHNYPFCLAGKHETSYEAARHEAVSDAITRLEDILGESVRTCQHKKLCVARNRVRKQINRAIREKNQRHEAEASLRAIESAFKEAEAALEEVGAARQVADEERNIKESELQKVVHAKNSVEAALGEEKKKTSQLFDDLDKEHEDRLACETSLLHLQSQLAALDAKLAAVMAEKDHITNENAKLHSDIQQLIGVCRAADARAKAYAKQNKFLMSSASANRAGQELPLMLVEKLDAPAHGQ